MGIFVEFEASLKACDAGINPSAGHRAEVKANCLLFMLGCMAYVESGHGAMFERESEATRVSLIELFTSEGCSSCPPAEAWLGRLTESPGLWRDFVPVSFHVDYWDGLGWPDRFARKEFTQRQRTYAQKWRSESVYTPGFVLDGGEWTDWRTSPPKRSLLKPGVLRVKETAPGVFSVSFSPTADAGNGWRFHLAILGNGVSSNVKAGENSGRKLVHDFVVIAYQEKQSAVNEASFELKPPKELAGGRLALAAWVSRAGEQEPIQALGGWWEGGR